MFLSFFPLSEANLTFSNRIDDYCFKKYRNTEMHDKSKNHLQIHQSDTYHRLHFSKQIYIYICNFT